jgi:hypothetical protein
MSNLPPGVTVSMIPGNRPEDLDEEAFWYAFETRLAKILTPAQMDVWNAGMSDANEDILVAAVTLARDMGYERLIADDEMEDDLLLSQTSLIRRIEAYG